MMEMPSNAYQVAYLEAIQMLRARGKIVGDPYSSADGTRRVLVDGLACEDDLVLEQAWGKEAAVYYRKSSSN